MSALDTRLCTLLGVRYPIIQTGMGWVSGARLTAATSEAGGLVFQSGTELDEDGLIRTNGGRVLTVVGRGPDLEAARAAAERLAEGITFDGLQRRHDIALNPPAAAVVGSRVPAAVPA